MLIDFCVRSCNLLITDTKYRHLCWFFHYSNLTAWVLYQLPVRSSYIGWRQTQGDKSTNSQSYSVYTTYRLYSSQPCSVYPTYRLYSSQPCSVYPTYRLYSSQSCSVYSTNVTSLLSFKCLLDINALVRFDIHNIMSSFILRGGLVRLRFWDRRLWC